MGLSGRWAYCKKASLNVNYSDRDGLSCTGKSDGGVGGGGGEKKPALAIEIYREKLPERTEEFDMFILIILF